MFETKMRLRICFPCPFFSKAQLFSREWEVLIEPSVRVILSLDLLQSGDVLSIDGLQRFVPVGKVDVPVCRKSEYVVSS